MVSETWAPYLRSILIPLKSHMCLTQLGPTWNPVIWANKPTWDSYLQPWTCWLVFKNGPNYLELKKSGFQVAERCTSVFWKFYILSKEWKRRKPFYFRCIVLLDTFRVDSLLYSNMHQVQNLLKKGYFLLYIYCFDVLKMVKTSCNSKSSWYFESIMRNKKWSLPPRS